MDALLLKSSLVTILASSLIYAGIAADLPKDPKFVKFKTKMLPQVGQKITAIGKLDFGKAGWWLSYDDWGMYIKTTTTNRADLAKLNALGRFRLHTVKAVGTLQHQNEWRHENPMAQGTPEHFFFDVRDVTVTDSEPASPRASDAK
jgi:hypothetical protein